MADNDLVLGMCTRDEKLLEIRDDQSDKETVDTFIHEVLHGEFPKASEKSIARAATELTQALLRMGCFK